ncbi:hypothetical protein [Hydrocarboniphaga effusa]|uniref:hypothetical protein n=1 Tax=Hydrocarboniphaga effusa TaxID=243629 RepID=UPI00398BF765
MEVVVGPVEGDSEPAAKMLLRIRRGLIDSLTKAPTLVDESPDDQPVKRTAKAKK